MVDSLPAIKQAASGRWPEILTALGGVDPELLDGQHHPCPKCRGTDRFRLIDEEAGALYCSKCFDKENGDGIAALRWLQDWDFATTLVKLGDYLGLASDGNRQKGNSKSPDLCRKLSDRKKAADCPDLVQMWCDAKPPIRPEAVEAFCSVAKFAGEWVLVFEGRNSKGHLKALLLVRVDGQNFPACGKLSERKTHLVGESTESWIFAGSVKDLRAATVIVKCEGPGDALALVSSGLPDGWVVITNACGAKSANPKNLAFGIGKGKPVVVVGDADEPGQDGTRRHAAQFQKADAADVRIPQLPYQITPTNGKDLRDWLAEGHDFADFQKLVGATKPVTAEDAAKWGKKSSDRPKGPHDDRPTIKLDIDEPRILTEAVDALGKQTAIYQRGPTLVQIVQNAPAPRGLDRPPDGPRIAPAADARLKEILTAAANWEVEAGENVDYKPCPPWVVRGVVARGEWPGVRRLESIVEAPTLRADGSVVQEPGYDEATGLFFSPQVEFPSVPNCPGIDDVIRARDDLLEVIVDFPMGDNTHRAAWLAGVLAVFSRFAFDGPCPLSLIDANVRGSGKSLLADTIGVLASGRAMARMANPRDDEEARKRITAIALAGEPLVLIDNVAGTLGSPSLDAALTATFWADRLLGGNEIVSIPLYTTWFATGNNVILGADTSRRTLHIRLESTEEHPEERTGFRHEKLLSWLRRHRPRLAVAALTILRGYHVAGRPDLGLPPWGSFEAWSDLVRQSVVWSGMADPGATRQALAESDTEATSLRQLIDGWERLDPDSAGLTTTTVMQDILRYDQSGSPPPDGLDQVRAAIVDLVPSKGGTLPTARSVGVKLRHLKRRVIGGKSLDAHNDHNGNRWFVSLVSQDSPDSRNSAGTNGTVGTNPATPREVESVYTNIEDTTGGHRAKQSP